MIMVVHKYSVIVSIVLTINYNIEYGLATSHASNAFGSAPSLPKTEIRTNHHLENTRDISDRHDSAEQILLVQVRI